MVIIYDPSSPSTLPVKYFLVSLFISIQFFYPWVAGCHLIIEDVFFKPISSLFFRCWFFNNFVRPFSSRCFSSSFELEDGVLFSVLLFRRSTFYSFIRRHCDVSLFSHHLKLWGSCSFRAYPFNRSVVPFAQVLFALSSLASLFNRSACMYFLSIATLFLCLSTYKVILMFLVPLF